MVADFEYTIPRLKTQATNAQATNAQATNAQATSGRIPVDRAGEL
jgi:hypothetical protein